MFFVAMKYATFTYTAFGPPQSIIGFTPLSGIRPTMRLCIYTMAFKNKYMRRRQKDTR